MKTAVEYLIKHSEELYISKKWEEIFERAKQIEKQQILDAWKHGKMMGNSQLDFSEEYYNQTFKSEKNESK
jgi:hypothetical protein